MTTLRRIGPSKPIVNTDFTQPVFDTEISTVKWPVDKTVRIYCYQHAARWNLQIRGHLPTPKKPSVIASAALTKDQLLALRDAINALIDEANQ